MTLNMALSAEWDKVETQHGRGLSITAYQEREMRKCSGLLLAKNAETSDILVWASGGTRRIPPDASQG